MARDASCGGSDDDPRRAPDGGGSDDDDDRGSGCGGSDGEDSRGSCCGGSTDGAQRDGGCGGSDDDGGRDPGRDGNNEGGSADRTAGCGELPAGQLSRLPAAVSPRERSRPGTACSFADRLDELVPGPSSFRASTASRSRHTSRNGAAGSLALLDALAGGPRSRRGRPVRRGGLGSRIASAASSAVDPGSPAELDARRLGPVDTRPRAGASSIRTRAPIASSARAKRSAVA
jgi:hypothetical protein